MALHIMVKLITDELKNSNKPLSVSELATRLECTPQHIRNHAKTAISLDLIREAKFKQGKAVMYESTTRASSIHPQVPVGNDEYALLRDMLIGWHKRSALPTNQAERTIAQVVITLYKYAVNFYAEGAELSPAERKDMLKEERFKLKAEQNRTRNYLDQIDALLNEDDLWSPKDLAKTLIIKDDEITVGRLMEILDALNAISSKSPVAGLPMGATPTKYINRYGDEIPNGIITSMIKLSQEKDEKIKDTLEASQHKWTGVQIKNIIDSNIIEAVLYPSNWDEYKETTEEN